VSVNIRKDVLMESFVLMDVMPCNFIDISEKCTASTCRVKEKTEQETSNKMKVVRFSEISLSVTSQKIYK
jgi:hypothetical protein